VSTNVWRLAGDTLNITCNFLYCDHQVHTDFLIALYNISLGIVQFETEIERLSSFHAETLLH